MLVSMTTSSAGLGTKPVDQFVPVNQSFVVPIQFTVCAGAGEQCQIRRTLVRAAWRSNGRRLRKSLGMIDSFDSESFPACRRTAAHIAISPRRPNFPTH